MSETMTATREPAGTDRPEEVGADVVLAEIKRNCFLLYVTVSAWSGRYMMRNSEVKIDGRVVDEKMRTNGSWKLIPDNWQKALAPFEGKARRAVREVGVVFKDGVYVVPKAKARALVETLQNVRREYMLKVGEFQREWPAIVRRQERDITAELGAQPWAEIAKILPSAEKLPRLYGIEIGLWPVGGGGGPPVECYDDLRRASDRLDRVSDLLDRLEDGADLDHYGRETLADFVAVVRSACGKASSSAGRMIEENAEEWMAEAQEATSRLVRSAVETMIEEPVREFTEQVENLARLTESQTVRDATLDAVRRAYEKLDGFSFMMPAELTDRLKAVASRVAGTNARDMNSRSVAGQRINEALQAVSAELAEDLKDVDALGRLPRRLDI